MTSQIIIFKPPEDIQIKTNKTERQILYEQFAQNASIPSYHFNTFMEMVETDEISRNPQSTLPSILIKYILQFCTPIIRDIPDFNIRLKTVDVFNKKKTDERDTLKTYYNISLQLEHSIECVIENANKKNILKKITIPKHVTFSVIGIILPNSFIKRIDKTFLNYAQSLNVTEILNSGNFGLMEFQSKTYTQYRIPEIRTKNIYNGNDIVYFTSDADSLHKLKIISRYIKYTDRFYDRNIRMIYNYLYDLPFITHIKEQNALYNIFHPEFLTKEKNIQHNSAEKQMASLIKIKLSNSELQNDFVFSHYHLFDSIQKIMILGISHPISKKILQNLDQIQSFDNTISDYNRKKFRKRLEYAKKQAIALNKFQTTNLDKLTSIQHKIINLEFDKMEKYYTALKKHGADFKVVDSLFWAIANGKTKIMETRLNEISKIVKIPSNLEDPKLHMLQNTHKINLICPHVIAKVKKILKPTKNEIQKSGIIREYLINKFSLPVNVDGYFCRICGELLADADDEEVSKYIAGKRVSFVMEIDRLKTQIWKEVAHIMTVYVKFKNAVNIKNLITSVTDTLRPELGTIEFNLSKIKTNSKDSIKELMSIYTSIYTMALVVNMIMKNYGQITFSMRPSKGGGRKNKSRSKKKRKKSSKRRKKQSPIMESSGSDADDDESEYIMHDNSNTSKESDDKLHKGGNMEKSQMRLKNIINNALFIILLSKNVTINNVTSMSNDSIKPILIKAYKWVTSLKQGSTQEKNVNERENIVFQKDKIYKYVVYVLDLVNHYSKNSSKNKTYSVKDVLGRSWPTIESEFKDKSIYETATIPPLWENTEFSKYKYESFKFLMEYVKLKLYDENAVPYSLALAEHDDKYNFLHKLEQKIHNDYKTSILRPFNDIAVHENFMLKFNDFRPKCIKIDKIYDNSGIKHKFDIYIYQKGDSKGLLSGPKKELKKKDILEWFKNIDSKKTDDFKHWFIVDERCSVCKTLLSNTKNVSIERELNKRNAIIVFYKYYENICPKGELHNFIISEQKKKEDACSKCELTRKMFDSLDTSYYKKFLSIYEKMQNEKRKLEKNDVSKLCSTTKEIEPIKKFPVWQINNAPILELSRTFKIKYNIWINIGLTINSNYKLIENEKINPSSNASDRSLVLRNIQLFSYYLQIVKIYYLIKNYTIIEHLPYDLKQILSKNKISNLNKKLIDVDKDIPLKYYYYKKNATPIIVSNFLLYSISNTILTIHKSMKKNNINVTDELILYIIKSIIDDEKLLSKPDLTKFKASVIAKNDIDESLPIDISDIDGDDVQNGYVSAVESEKSLLEMEDTNPDNEFATGDLDIEADEQENLMGNPMDF